MAPAEPSQRVQQVPVGGSGLTLDARPLVWRGGVVVRVGRLGAPAVDVHLRAVALHLLAHHVGLVHLAHVGHGVAVAGGMSAGCNVG